MLLDLQKNNEKGKERPFRVPIGWENAKQYKWSGTWKSHGREYNPIFHENKIQESS